MNRKDIVTLPATVLRKKAKLITKTDHSIRNLAEDMVSATLDWEDHRKYEVGVALAANQVGKLHRVIVVRNDYKNKEDRGFKVFINPEIIKAKGEPIERHEGCLSVKDVYGLVPRYPRIKVHAQTLQGKTVRFIAKGFLARIFQHEIDHLDGKLFIDRVKNNQFFELDAKGELVPLNKKLVN
jgi:peptide deformylase